MKKYTVSTNELIGRAFVEADMASYEHEKKYAKEPPEPVVALHRSDIRREAIEATDTVRMVGDVDVEYQIMAAEGVDEFSAMEKARAELG